MKQFLFLCAALFFLTACDDDNQPDPPQTDLLAKLDFLTADTYRSTDMLELFFPGFYGVWEVTGTGGGFAGTGYEQDFDVLLLKSNHIYGLVRNDSLVAYGQLQLNPQANYANLNFLRDENSATEEFINLDSSNAMAVQLSGNSMTIGQAAFDGFDTYFERIEE